MGGKMKRLILFFTASATFGGLMVFYSIGALDAHKRKEMERDIAYNLTATAEARIMADVMCGRCHEGTGETLWKEANRRAKEAL